MKSTNSKLTRGTLGPHHSQMSTGWRCSSGFQRWQALRWWGTQWL